MADYHPLIARAVAGLEKNTGEARRSLYERARTALLAQLRGVTPSLDEAEITRERLALEEAIRKVEAEAARRAREEPRPAAPKPAMRDPDTARRFDVPHARQPASKPESASESETQSEPELPIDQDGDQKAGQNAGQKGNDAPASPPPPWQPPSAESTPRKPPRSRLFEDEGLKGFRNTVGPTPEPPPPPREPRPQRSTGVPKDLDRLEADILDDVRGSVRPRPNMKTGAEPPSSQRPRPPGPISSGSMPSDHGESPDQSRRPQRKVPRSYSGLLKVAVPLLILLLLAGVGYWQRDGILAYYKSIRRPTTQTAQQSPAERPKISDRIGPGGQEQTQSGAQVPAVAQRVVLYEEDPANPQGNRFVGSAIWRTDTVSPGPGQPPEVVIRADVEVPDRHMTMKFSIRRNTDKALPASHTIEVMFNLPSDFPHGGVANIPGVLMKQAEQTRGTPLAGLAVKVTAGYFLIGLSALDTDVQRNIELLKDRAWFDIPIVYNDNRRAILAMEKGTPGERAFADAFKAWGE